MDLFSLPRLPEAVVQIMKRFSSLIKSEEVLLKART